jgi:hypothetical protein
MTAEATIIDVDTLRAHVRELEAEHAEEIRIEWGTYKGGKGAVAHQHERKVRLPYEDIRSAADYAVVLHELGHLLGEWQSGSARWSGPPMGRLVEEAGAWVWAKGNAVAWTPAMERKMNRSLQNYASRAASKSRQGNARIVPGARHVFWKLAGKPRSDYRFYERNVRRPTVSKPKPTKEELQRQRIEKLIKQRANHEGGIRKAHSAVKRKETAIKKIDQKLRRYEREGHSVEDLRVAANRKGGA